MSEAKSALKRIAVYYLLLAINIIPCANFIPDAFPTRNLSAVYLLTLTVCLVMYYTHRVSPTGGVPAAMKAIAWMGLLLILLRGVKYGAVAEVGVLARHTWYLYYVPMLLIPLFLFYISLFVTASESRCIVLIWRLTLALTAAFIALVLTNDLHGLVFGFRPGFENWDVDYSHGLLFYVLTGFEYTLYFSAIAILVVRCRIVSTKKKAWIILIPFAVGIAMNVLLLIGKMPKINGTNIVEFPEALICTAAVAIECLMQLGLIPTNTDYGRFFRELSISAQITDRKGTPVFSSRAATPLTAEQIALSGGSRIGDHTVLNKMEIPGGYGFWLDDMTEPDRLRDELTEAKEELAQEAELIRLRNELKERQSAVKQRTLMYDTIAQRTREQSRSITRLAETARNSSDPAVKEDCRRRITLLGAYIKRYANLALLSQQSDYIESGELELSVSEVLRYLNYCSVPGELIFGSDCAVRADAALAAFEAFDELLESNIGDLRGVFVNLSGDKNAAFKMTFENLRNPLSDETADRLSSVGIISDVKREDDVTYICLTLPGGGEDE